MESFLISSGIILLYYLLINLISYFLMGHDKRKAIKKSTHRTPEAKFINLSILGGGVGILLARGHYRHKTSAAKRMRFLILPIVMVLFHIGIWGLFPKELFNAVTEGHQYLLTPSQERVTAPLHNWGYR